MEEAEISLHSVLSLLRRQSRLISVVVVGLTIVAAVLTFTLTPIYNASALVLIDTSAKNLLDPNFQSAGIQIDDARVASEVEIIQASPVLLEVISQAGLISDPEFGVSIGLRDRILSYLQLAKPVLPTGEAALQRVLDSVRKAFSVERRARTNLVTLTVKSEDPAKAARLANIWAQAYVSSQVAAKIDATLLSRNALQARLEAARSRVVQSEGSLDSFLDDNLPQIVKESGRTELASMRDRLASLAAESKSSADLAKVVESSLASRNWASLTQSLQNQALQEMEKQRQDLTQRVGNAVGASATDLRAELAKIEQKMVDTAQRQLNDLNTSIAGTADQESQLRQQLRSAVLSSPLSPDILARVYELQQTSELARSQYQTLLARIQDLDIQANLQVADSRIVAEAMTPQTAAFPNVPMLLAAAVAGSALLAIVLAYLREHLIGGLLTVEQTAAVLRVPVAAALPRLRRTAEGGGGGPADVVVDSMLSPYSESVRRIRAAVEQRLRRQRQFKSSASKGSGVTIMVTSSAPGEGKTTVALSLARSMAIAKRHVLLIDCDLRRPSVHTTVGLPPDGSFAQALADETATVELSGMVKPDPQSDVGLILASASTEFPTDQLVGSPAFAAVLDRLASHFDAVILDTPPIGAVVDGLYIAPLVDAILYVVRSGSTRQSEARAGIASVSSVKREDAVVLAVLNQQDSADATYRRQYTGYGY
ncbi:MAG: polysaccharide biosynthesis tyrosine autokinase [Devosia sp.]|uniref:GumC family protein n=1 Tax=Devosia sp. TaxID=1871048 RepID=UPI001AD4690D|nr:polysaccharide biosynthesis tyrosine autokinase [Devosia sp.]MBN9317455.1 polysaccharide biosynthesis tyrosine autokinase [Devosia sp.]